jgi:hypothetical protein
MTANVNFYGFLVRKFGNNSKNRYNKIILYEAIRTSISETEASISVEAKACGCREKNKRKVILPGNDKAMDRVGFEPTTTYVSSAIACKAGILPD